MTTAGFQVRHNLCSIWTWFNILLSIEHTSELQNIYINICINNKYLFIIIYNNACNLWKILAVLTGQIFIVLKRSWQSGDITDCWRGKEQQQMLASLITTGQLYTLITLVIDLSCDLSFVAWPRTCLFTTVLSWQLLVHQLSLATVTIHVLLFR